MFDFYTSPVSNIPPQPHPNPAAQDYLSAPKMARTSSSSSTSSNMSSASIAISSRPGSSSASFSSSYWSSPSASSSPSTSYVNASGNISRPSHHRHNSNGTSYLPTPFRSSLMHSSAATSPSPRTSTGSTSSYISDDDLLALDFEPLPPPSNSLQMNREMTTEEQVAAVRDQVEQERQYWGLCPEGPQAPTAFGAGYGLEKRNRALRFAGDNHHHRKNTGGYGGATGRRRFLAPSAGVSRGLNQRGME